MQTRYASVDLTKYIASLLVIAIHTGLFSDVNRTLSFITVDIICRLAVPFFAVCTGYFVGKAVSSERTYSVPRKSSAIFLRQWKKMVLLYLVWTIIYMVFAIPKWIEIGWFSLWAFIDYAIAACTGGSYYHLWYLWGMVYTFPVFYAILRWVPKKCWPGIAVILWILKVTEYAYAFLIPVPLSGILPVLKPLGTTLCLLPLLIVGALISQKSRRSLRFYLIGFAASFALLISEAFSLVQAGQTAVSYVLFTLPTAYFLFNCVLLFPIRNHKGLACKAAAVSTFVYCVHPILVETLSGFIQNSILHFLLCAVGSTALGTIYSLFPSKQT